MTVFKKISDFLKKIRIANLLGQVLDFAEVLTNEGFEENLEKFAKALKGSKIQITPENVEKLAYVLGSLDEGGLDELYKAVKEAEA